MRTPLDRITTAFLVTSVVATVALGGAVVYELGRGGRTQLVGVAAGDQLADGVPAGESEIFADGSDAAGATATTGAAAGGAATTNTARRSTVGATRTTTSGPAAQTGATGGAAAGGGAGAVPANVTTQKVTGGVIKIGGLFDETGPIDSTVHRDVIRAWFSKVNEAGGINGKTLQLVDCDTKFNVTDAVNCANKLINDDKVFAVVGSVAPNGEDATVKRFVDAGIPVIGGLGTPEEFKYPLSFPVAPSFSTYGQALGNRAGDLKFENTGLVLLNVGFMAPVKAELKRALAARGVSVVAEEVVDATKANYADVVLDLRTKGAKSVIAVLDPFSYQRLFQSMEGAGFKPPLLGLGLDKTSANKGYGKFVDGMHSLTPFVEPADHATHPGVREYIDTVKRYFPGQVDALDVYSESTWTAAKLFTDALRRAGADPSRAALVSSLDGTSGFQGGLSATPISYNGKRDPARCFWMLQNKSQVWTTVTETACF
ncbi:MAG TPA: ABC transporter substrate-binding protein [Acidimicrobiia bacterium]|nr:ABC transporter substrate-binding protein [Acidimicrobiia bacterium]